MAILFPFAFIRELIEMAPGQASSLTLYAVALKVCNKLSEGNSWMTDTNKNAYVITHSIHQLLCHACVYCSEGLFGQVLSVYKFSHVLSEWQQFTLFITLLFP